MNLDRLRVKLIAILVLISTVPLVLFAIVIYKKEAELVRNRALSHLETIVAHNALMIDWFLRERIQDLNLFAAVKNIDKKTIATHLELIQREQNIYRHLFMANLQGGILFESGSYDILGQKLLGQELLKPLRNGIPFVGDVNLSATGSKHDLLVAVPVKSSTGKTIAVLGAIIDFQGIAHVMKNIGIGRTGEVYLMNKNGVFLTTTRLEKNRVGERITPERFADYFTPIGPDEYMDYRGKKVVRVFKKISGPEWFLIGEQDSTEVFGDIANLRRIFIGFVALLIVLITLTGYFISNRTVRLLKTAYEQKKELEIQIIQKDKLASMGLLTAGIAHELNTPLASALLYTQMLKEEAKGSCPSYIERLGFIEEEIKRGSRIIRSLLDFSRQSQTDSLTADINNILSKLLDISEKLCSDKRIEVRRSLEEGIPMVKGNASILHQVFMNIVANAVEAMEKGGTLSVVTRYVRALHRVTVEIHDTGPGIPEEYLPDVFDPFFTKKPSTEGTGLGLAISYSMVRKMGGNIRVTSSYRNKTDSPTKATGTTFTVELPVQENDQKINEG